MTSSSRISGNNLEWKHQVETYNHGADVKRHDQSRRCLVNDHTRYRSCNGRDSIEEIEDVHYAVSENCRRYEREIRHREPCEHEQRKLTLGLVVAVYVVRHRRNG